MRRRLVSVAHSYCVGLNRRLAHEMARVGAAGWDVTAVAPRFFHGDLRPIHFRAEANEPCTVEAIAAYFTRRIHLMFYGRKLRELLRASWDLVHCWEEPYVPSCWQVAWSVRPSTPFVFWTAQNISKRYP